MFTRQVIRRGFSTLPSDLTKSIYHFNKSEYADSLTHLNQILKDDRYNNDVKAIAHLYTAKVLLNGSTMSELLACSHVEKANHHFNQDSVKDQYPLYKEDLDNINKSFDSCGGLNNYKDKLKLHLLELNDLTRI